MAHARINQLTPSPEWWKHLRKDNKRRFWKAERRAERELIEKEISSEKGLRQAFEKILSEVPDSEPDERDKL